MYRIITKHELAPKIDLLEVHVPGIASKAQPGQFVILTIHEKGERVPLTIAGYDREKGTITIVFNEVGKTTKQLGTLQEGDFISNIAGPLGNPSEIQNFGRVLVVGGGVMVAPLYLVAKALREAGNEMVVVVGARIKELLILEEEMRAIADEFYVTTDDGSKGYKGLEFLKELLGKEKFDRVVVMGPVVLMKTVSDITKPFNVKTIVTLTPIMVDGMGMCGACRVTVGGETKFGCVDGPEFDGHRVDFDELIKRQRVYLPEERLASVFYEKLGGCRCGEA